MNTQFNLQTLTTTMAGSLRALEPDTDGFYLGIPVTVLGMASRNKVMYDLATMVSSMTNPDTRFNKAITGGGLDGEWGHPDMSTMTVQQMMNRLMLVDPTKVSHYFKRLYTEQTSDGKYTLVRADVKPAGPYAKYLTEAFQDKDRDIGFSLRAMTTNPVAIGDGISMKKVLAMVTYDAITLMGYEIASKRAALEDLGVLTDDTYCSLAVADVEEIEGVAETIGYESIACQEVLDMLQTDEVKVSVQSTDIGTLDLSRNAIATGGVHSRSIFHTMHTKR